MTPEQIKAIRERCYGLAPTSAAPVNARELRALLDEVERLRGLLKEARPLLYAMGFDRKAPEDILCRIDRAIHGEPGAAEGGVAMDPRLDTHDWAQVFGERHEGYPAENAMSVEVVPGDTCSDAPFTREDVAEVLHIAEESGREYADWNGVAVVRLKDGRFACLSGWSDSSGWG